MRDSSLSLLQGTLDLLVMKALIFGPLHGYAVARWIRETTDGALQIDEGALYAALHRMERRRWLASEWGQSENNRRAKYYSITSEGRRQLASQTRSWNDYSRAVFQVLATSEGAGG